MCNLWTWTILWMGSANERRHCTINVVSHWLNPYTQRSLYGASQVKKMRKLSVLRWGRTVSSSLKRKKTEYFGCSVTDWLMRNSIKSANHWILGRCMYWVSFIAYKHTTSRHSCQQSFLCLHIPLFPIQHIETETKWPVFYKRYFWINFLHRCILIQILLKFVPRARINNKPWLVQIRAWRWKWLFGSPVVAPNNINLLIAYQKLIMNENNILITKIWFDQNWILWCLLWRHYNGYHKNHAQQFALMASYGIF